MSQPQNIYGVDLAMSTTGDLVVNSAGSLTVLGGVDVTAQAILLRLSTALGDLPLHPGYGSTLPIGSKVDVTGLVAAMNSELAEMTGNDPRFRSAKVLNASWPVGTNTSAIQLEVKVTLAGGETFTVSGLPAEARVSEVSLTTAGEGDGPTLTPLDEQEYFADETEAAEIASGSAVQSLVNDLEPEPER